jgi:hypothetical protein
LGRGHNLLIANIEFIDGVGKSSERGIVGNSAYILNGLGRLSQSK